MRTTQIAYNIISLIIITAMGIVILNDMRDLKHTMDQSVDAKIATVKESVDAINTTLDVEAKDRRSVEVKTPTATLDDLKDARVNLRSYVDQNVDVLMDQQKKDIDMLIKMINNVSYHDDKQIDAIIKYITSKGTQ